MSVVRFLLTAFLAGEIDPHLQGRVDTPQHRYGLTTCENFIPINEGPLVKRQGYFFVRPAAETASWLTAFRFSIEQEYVFEWSELALRVYTKGGRIETDPDTPYVVTTPYAAKDAAGICHQQSYNRLYLNHPSYPPAAILRNSVLGFGHEVLGLENGPFLDTNTDKAKKIGVSAASGAGVAITSNFTGAFDPLHVGAQLRLEAEDFALVPQWEPGMKDVVVGDQVRNEGRVYQAASAGKTGNVPPVHSEGTYYDGMRQRDELNDKGPYGVRWTYLHDRFGIVEITAVANSTAATGTVLRRVPDSVVTAPRTYKWAFQAFSEKEGWPGLVALFKGRRIDIKDLDFTGSVVDDYGGGRVNYATFSDSGLLAADLGFRRTLATEDPPIWISADRKLLVGTASREIAVGPANAGAVFSGENIEAEPQSYYGSEAIAPVRIATETIFVERGGRRLRSADYDFGRDRYDAPDLTAAARHITQGGILQLAFQRIPHALVYGVREDGQLVVHPKTRGEIKGFAREVLGGAARAKSAVCVVGEDNRTDNKWLLVERENGFGETVKEIWRQAEWRELGAPQADSYYVDGGARFTATGGDGSFSGLDHLARQEVVALVNGVVVRDLLVSDAGTVDLPQSVIPEDDYTCVIGLPYTAIATTTRPHIEDGGNSSAGLRQRVIKSVLRVLETLGLKVRVPGGVAEEFILREDGQAMDQAVPLVTDDVEGLVEAEFDRDGRCSWISEDPLPAIITLGVQNIDVSWKDE